MSSEGRGTRRVRAREKHDVYTWMPFTRHVIHQRQHEQTIQAVAHQPQLAGAGTRECRSRVRASQPRAFGDGA